MSLTPSLDRGRVAWLAPQYAGATFALDGDGSMSGIPGAAYLNGTYYNALADVPGASITGGAGFATGTTLDGRVIGPFAPNTLPATDAGFEVWEARTNKCLGPNHNPVDSTRLTKFGDPAAVLSVVDDPAALALAGLSGVCTNGKVYRLDNSAGTTEAGAACWGQALNTNPHTNSAWVRGGSGSIRETWSGAGATFGSFASYTRVIAAGVSPGNASSELSVRANAGQVVYFILFQREEGSFATPVIPTTSASATRTLVVASAPVPAETTACTIVNDSGTSIGYAPPGGTFTLQAEANAPWANKRTQRVIMTSDQRDVGVGVTGATSLSVRIDTSDGQATTLQWGDGTTASVNSGATGSKTYGSAYTGGLIIRTAIASSKVTRFDSASNGWAFDLSSIPNATFVAIYGSNTISGNLSSISNVTFVALEGANTISGNLSSIPNATYVSIGGSNTVTGSLSSIPNATYVNIQGSNTVSGNLSSIPNATTVSITGSNTISGNLSSIPNATYVSIGGSNTVTGSLSSIPNATYVVISGSNTVSLPSSWTTATVRRVRVRGASARPSAEVDAFLIALAATATTWTNERVVDIRGTRTSASDAAVTTLQGRGVTVTVTP